MGAGRTAAPNPAVRSSIDMVRQRSTETPIPRATSALARRPPEFRRKIAGQGVHLFLTPAEIAGCPVQLAQAVEDGALDAVFRIALEGHVLGAVELLNRIDQPQDAGMDQVLDVDMDREVLVHPNGDRLGQRKIFEHDPVTRFPPVSRPPADRRTSSLHRFLPLVWTPGSECSGRQEEKQPAGHLVSRA